MIANAAFFIEQIATGLYILIGVGILLSLRAWGRSRGDYHGSHFELERDIARYQGLNALTALVLLVELALFVFGVQRVVTPALREALDVPQQVVMAGDGVFVTPTPAPMTGELLIDPNSVQLGGPDLEDQILPTPTLTPTPVGTIVPNAPGALGCTSPEATLQIPANGMIVHQPIAVVGTASAENFAFYRLELFGPSTFGNFVILSTVTQSVPELGELGQFVPAFYEPGEYRFRIQVFDIASELRSTCEVTIYVSDPIPTPTPLGTEGAP